MDTLERDVERIFYETRSMEGSRNPEESEYYLKIREWLDKAVLFGIFFVLLPVILLTVTVSLWRNIRLFFSSSKVADYRKNAE